MYLTKRSIMLFFCMQPGLMLCNAMADEVVTLSTRPEVTQTFLLMEPEAEPRGVVVMFPGHEGVVKFTEVADGNFEVDNEQGGLTAKPTARNLLRDKGFVVAVLAPPSDQSHGMDTQFRTSKAHAEDVRQVIEYLNERYEQRPYLQGHCRSSYSPPAVVSRLGNDRISGLILSSTRSRGKHGSVLDLKKGAVKVPVLLVHHTDDPCPGTPYSNLDKLTKFYSNGAPTVDVIAVSGGHISKKGSSRCSGGAHGFKGVEQDVSEAIAQWLSKQSFPEKIEKEAW
jgi:hypothetical protein